MPSKKLYSAAEIAELRLPGLPTTKARVIQRAATEGWPFEEATGLGGKRRLYDVPLRYLSEASPAAPGSDIESVRRKAELREMSGGLFRACDSGWSDPEEAKRLSRPGLGGAVAVEEEREGYSTSSPGAPTAIAAGAKADPELLALAVQAVEEWCQESGKTLSPGRKGSVAAVLYDYLARGAGAEDVRKFLQAVG